MKIVLEPLALILAMHVLLTAVNKTCIALNYSISIKVAEHGGTVSFPLSKVAGAL